MSTSAIYAQGARQRALSPSQVGCYLDCAAKWFYRYDAGLPDPPTGALAIGRAVHATIAWALDTKRAEGLLPTQADTAQAFDAAVSEEIAAAELRPDEDAAQLAAKGLDLVELYLRQVAPNLQTIATESAVQGHIAGVLVHGIADIITADHTVIDIKTAARKPAGISPDHALQLTTYAVLAQCPRAAIHTLTKTAAPAFVGQSFDVTPAHIRYAEAMYSHVADAIESRIFTPRRPSNLCSRKHCAFWRNCEADFGGEVPA